VHYYNPLPIWDYWNVVQHLPRYRAFDFRVLWEQHNEHRIVFPEIIFALDMLLAHGRQIVPLAISFLCYFSTWVVMSWAVFSDRSLTLTIRLLAVLLAGIVIGWQGSVMALGIPFLLNWTVTQCALVLALGLVAALRRTSRISFLIGTVICGTIATYSSGNGMLVWPVILVVSWVSSLRSRYMLVLGIAAISNIGLYFVDYRVSGGLDLGKLLSHPLYLVGFLSSYVSMPFGLLQSPQFGIWVGLLNLLLFFSLLAIAARARLLASAPAIVLFGYLAFTLLTALLTAAGRMNPDDLTFTAAKASRYLTVPLANWAALVLSLMWVAARRSWKIASSRNIAVTVGVLLWIMFPKFSPWLAQTDFIFARQQWGTVSVENGLLDPDMIRYIFPDLMFVKLYLPELRDHRLSLFSRGYSASLGESFAGRFPGTPMPRQTGAVTHTRRIHGGVEIVGWAEGSRSERIVFVNESGRIVGLGGKLQAGFPPELQSTDTPSSLAWVGFINSAFETRSFLTYVIDRHRSGIAPIAGPSVIPAVAANDLP